MNFALIWTQWRLLGLLAILLASLLVGIGITAVSATHLSGDPATYTLDGDFDEGTAINVVHSTPDQLQLDNTTTPFPFICSNSRRSGKPSNHPNIPVGFS